MQILLDNLGIWVGIPYPTKGLTEGMEGEILQRLQNESKFDYIIRLVEGKINGICDIDYAEFFRLAFDVEFSSDEARKRFYGIKMLLPYIDKEKIENIDDNSILKELENKKQEIEKEKFKIQLEKSTLSQLLREQARFELFVERAVSEINKLDKLQIPEAIIPTKNNTSGVLIFADCHYDKELEIKGLKGEILNKYSPEIFEERMWKLLSEASYICDKEDYKEISVFNMGDELEGMLRISQLMNLKYGLVESAIRYSYFLANWLNQFSKQVKINYYATSGNHTDVRLLTGKKGDFPHENMSKVIHTLISEIVKDNPNITIHNNETEKIYTKIQGFNILGLHGEEKDVMQSIRDYSFMYDEKIDYLVSGHKHHANSVNLGFAKGCIGVGSIIGIDDYSMQLKRISDPTATFAVFEKDKGKTIEYTIKL